MKIQLPIALAIISYQPSTTYALSSNTPELSRRTTLRNIFNAGAVAFTTITPTDANAVTDEGVAVVTDSAIGRSFRLSAIKGARVIDNLDEKWERYSDSLRDQNKCDDVTGRRLFDNGVRKDGTKIGNPVLGALCKPDPLLPLDQAVADSVLDIAVRCALKAGAAGGDAVALNKSIQEVEDLVRNSYERTIKNSASEDEKKRLIYNFVLYSRMRAINNSLKDAASIKNFQLIWGQELLSTFAPFANRNDYKSPFEEKPDEFEDYDYEKPKLLDALGSLSVTLDKFKERGLVGHFEISIPYDDYGSVVTVAIDDYTSIGSEILLSEQNFSLKGPGQALARATMEKAGILYDLDTFYIDPTTTRQSEYNPTQLLLSLSNLRKS